MTDATPFPRYIRRNEEEHKVLEAVEQVRQDRQECPRQCQRDGPRPGARVRPGLILGLGGGGWRGHASRRPWRRGG